MIPRPPTAGRAKENKPREFGGTRAIADDRVPQSQLPSSLQHPLLLLKPTEGKPSLRPATAPNRRASPRDKSHRFCTASDGPDSAELSALTASTLAEAGVQSVAAAPQAAKASAPLFGPRPPQRPATARQPPARTDATGPSVPRRAFNDVASLERLHRILRTHIGILRTAFKDVDPHRTGAAPIPQLRKVVVERLYLDPSKTLGHNAQGDGRANAATQKRTTSAFDALLQLADPDRTGVVEFGRLLRLIRADSLTTVLRQQQRNSSSRASPVTPEGSSECDEWGMDAAEDETRKRFADGLYDRSVTIRLRDNRKIGSVPLGSRPSGMLGDSKASSAPWAVAGDGARLSHLIKSMQDERQAALYGAVRNHVAGQIAAVKKARLREQAAEEELITRTRRRVGTDAASAAKERSIEFSPSRQAAAAVAAATRGTGERLTYPALLAAIRTVQPHVHEAEIRHYFNASMKRYPPPKPKVKGVNARPPPPQRTVDPEAFLREFAESILTTAALRCSAEAGKFDWSSKQPRTMAKKKLVVRGLKSLKRILRHEPAAAAKQAAA